MMMSFGCWGRRSGWYRCSNSFGHVLESFKTMIIMMMVRTGTLCCGRAIACAWRLQIAANGAAMHTRRVRWRVADAATRLAGCKMIVLCNAQSADPQIRRDIIIFLRGCNFWIGELEGGRTFLLARKVTARGAEAGRTMRCGRHRSIHTDFPIAFAFNTAARIIRFHKTRRKGFKPSIYRNKAQELNPALIFRTPSFPSTHQPCFAFLSPTKQSVHRFARPLNHRQTCVEAKRRAKENGGAVATAVRTEHARLYRARVYCACAVGARVTACGRCEMVVMVSGDGGKWTGSERGVEDRGVLRLSSRLPGCAAA